ncbi:MAG: sigma-54-dependent Fis family transcriptional regulator [bacterium]|nr:sigma-54-dependent Fis family transcriptional regulator [bacterium]
MKKKTVLVVEDNAICRGDIKRAIQHNYDCFLTETKADSINLLKQRHINLILLDLTLPDSTGFGFLEYLVASFPGIPIIIITEDDDPETAAEVIKKGARDYIRKSKFFEDTTILDNRIQEIFKTSEYKKISEARADQLAYLNRNIFIPDLPEYKSAYIQAEIAIKGGLSLLIHGETGVGKNILVTSIHQKLMGDRSLITVDCGAICSTLIESELFGHEKGSFTGADSSKKGKIELADGGILFLDEISNATLDVQVKILRALQEKKICRVGSNSEIPVDFMLISATNRDLLKEIEKNKFKEDLYYRIKQIEINLPPIRESSVALNQFINRFIEIYNNKYSCKYILTNKTLEYLLNKKWKGNLRELDLEIQKLIFTYSLGFTDELEVNKSISHQNNQLTSLKERHIKEEKEKILDALGRNNFKIAPTARELGIPRTTLQGRITKYNISY